MKPPLRSSRPFQTLLIRWAALIAGLLIAVETVCAAGPPPTAEEVQRLVKERPLDEATWPAWRDSYVRLFYAYEVGEPVEFYDQLRTFMGELASQNGGMLPKPWADDPIAWIIYSGSLNRSGFVNAEQVIAAARQSLSLGDPDGMSSHNLAHALVYLVDAQSRFETLTPENRASLDEAEERLDAVSERAPQARLSFCRGLIAWHRGKRQTALALLQQGAEDHPNSSAHAATYLTLWFSSEQAASPFAEATTPFAEQFPEDSSIQAIHAASLYRDERFVEAFDVLEHARQKDANVEQRLGREAVEAIEEGRWLTASVQQGIELANEGSHPDAVRCFRQSLQEDPENVVAASWLAGSLLASLGPRRRTSDSPELNQILTECSRLCDRFPNSPSLHVSHAMALFRAGHSEEAEAELDKAETLGADLKDLLGDAGLAAIREDASWKRGTRRFTRILLGGVSLSIVWILVMYLIGAALAVLTSRTPGGQPVPHEIRKWGDVWLERFYLLVLGSSLLFFYVSVPFVALGLLAITLGLLALMLAFRFIHLGVLHRGFFATWEVLRSAFVGPQAEHLGLKAKREDHPRLFAALDEVAQRLRTATVDDVYLSPGASIGVCEEGTGPFGIFQRRRVMEIGIATLPALTTSEFKSVLAHEFGHFSHQDPSYTRFISHVSGSLWRCLAVMNAAAGGINFINPFYWFYWLYLRAYALLASGFSRSREFLADRRAADAYGKQPFISGLTKVAVHGTMFERSAVPSIRSALSNGHSFINVFDAFRSHRDRPESEAIYEQVVKDIHETKPTWFDSHPTYSERIAAVAGFPDVRDPSPSGPATELLSNIQQVEEQLTERLTVYIYQRGNILELPEGIREN